MSHFNFVLPLNRDDLFEAPTRNQYTVENVYNSRDIKIKLAVIRTFFFFMSSSTMLHVRIVPSKSSSLEQTSSYPRASISSSP